MWSSYINQNMAEHPVTLLIRQKQTMFGIKGARPDSFLMIFLGHPSNSLVSLIFPNLENDQVPHMAACMKKKHLNLWLYVSSEWKCSYAQKAWRAADKLFMQTPNYWLNTQQVPDMNTPVCLGTVHYLPQLHGMASVIPLMFCYPYCAMSVTCKGRINPWNNPCFLV